ncbi:halocyanin domain-containing protein [Haladaptatus sp. DJG-WS-42]|uniref:halocyanin domain-containing protein n=1 Tax=Haladaptatus sp. DJG-WS-42 TaxID=3120516 RepID=UPI0030D49459
MDTSFTTPPISRRGFLKTATVLTVSGAALGTARPVAAQDDSTLTEWFANVSNYRGIVDKRGNGRVDVIVGAEGNGGGFAFDPPAVRVDPGTTIVWTWTGEGGLHNVVAEDDAYESELLEAAESTFEHTFDSEEVSPYSCGPHKPMGMKGAVIVGDIEVTASAPKPEYTYVTREPDYGDWFADVDNFEGTVDMRGQPDVRVYIGAEGNGGGFAISPPAIHIDPGTRVHWEWVGEDGPHEFVAEDGTYASALQSTGEWGYAFDGVGISKYACRPHGQHGMKGAIVVGDVFDGLYEVTPAHLSVFGALGAALLSPLAFGAFLRVRDRLDTRRKK